MKYFVNFLIAISMSVLPAYSQKKTGSNIEIKGIYGNPNPFWKNGFALNELGINAIFVHGGSIDQKMIDRARTENLKVFAEFATLNGKNYVDKHPEAWAIDRTGEKVEAASWFMGVCPTEPGFRQYRFSQLRDLLNKFDLDGVWMDYMHWHAQFEEPEPILPETCFCDHCLSTFSRSTAIEIPNGTTAEKATWILNNHDKRWRDWRCAVINEWVVEMRRIVKAKDPDMLLGLYHCPWNDDEFDGARRRILGLDYDLLKENIDVFSPMVYHSRMGRKPAWVEENIKWFSDRLSLDRARFPKLWPIVQASDEPDKVSPDEFNIVMLGGMAGASTGVMMFTSWAVASDKEKSEVVKRLYLGGAGQ